LAARRDRVLRRLHAPLRACASSPAGDPRDRRGRGTSMRYVVSFGRFWWDFIVGDDWRVAAGVAVGLGLPALLAPRGADAWWLLPACVALVLAESLRRATRHRP